MKNKTLIPVVAICAIFSLPVNAEPLSGDEIKGTFSGKTASGNHLKKGLTVRSYHSADGSYKRVLSDGTASIGKWWVEKGKLCVRFEGEEKQRCRFIESDGSGGFKKIKPKNGQTVVHFNSLSDGDQTE